MCNKIKFDYIGSPRLEIEGFDLKLAPKSDFWRVHLDYMEMGKNRELGVYSHMQNAPTVEHGQNSTIISYNGIIAEDNSFHDIKLSFEITDKASMLFFSAKITNNSSVRLNELQYPLFEFERINGDSQNDILYAPNGLGCKAKDPYEYVMQHHTEYMAADYKNVWAIHTSPSNMAWLAVESAGKLLYLANHNEKYRLCNLLVGASPRNSKSKSLIYTIASFPAALPGEELIYDSFVLAGTDGDFRKGADIYRSWADKTWLKNGCPGKEFAKKHFGWQRIILKHQFGEIIHTYNDLVKIYQQGAKYNINMLLLFAWWKEGMDNGYPSYEPDPELGGADALKAAIDEINGLGGTVLLYANGHIIDIKSDFYATSSAVTMKDLDNNEYREHYKFSNNGSMLRFGHKSFATGCYGTKEWTDKLIELEKKHLSLGSNGTFFDQLGGACYLCFDKNHKHGNRIDEVPEYMLRAVKQMRDALPKGSYFGTEIANDRLSAYMDFIHGCGFSQKYTPDAFPEMFRYAFPEVPVSNRFIHDEKEDFEKHLNYAFVYGLLFDVSIYRGRADSIDDTPRYAAIVKELTEKRKQYLDFFVSGKFDLYDMEMPNGIKGGKYTLDGKSIITVWNDTAATATVLGKELLPNAVDIIEL